MAITSADIHNQSFSIDRKGYDVDEVDVFLERVADEIDGLNSQIAQLESQLEAGYSEGDKFDGFDKPAFIDDEPEAVPAPEPAAAAPAVDEALLREKDERIAELERQLEAKKADDNAIAQALIIAQRSADEILGNAKAEAAATVKDAEDEADRILDKAENDRQKVIDAIKKLEDDREDAREDYKDLLTDFINDANRRLAEIGEKAPKSAGLSTSAHARTDQADAGEAAPALTPLFAAPQAPVNREEPVAYTAPAAAAATGAVVAAATPMPSSVEKDLSGFGDADDDFEFEELD